MSIPVEDVLSFTLQRGVAPMELYAPKPPAPYWLTLYDFPARPY